MDNYDTPDHIAALMAELAYGDTLEPAAGYGAIAKHLAPDSVCVEVDPHRYHMGRQVAPRCCWRNLDFLDLDVKPHFDKFDTVVTNPPFSKLLPFIEIGLKWVKPSGQLVYLMPHDWNAAKGRAKEWLALDAHIAQMYLIPGRVDYLVDGVAMSKKTREDGRRYSGRQASDTVFIIKPGPPPYLFFNYLAQP